MGWDLLAWLFGEEEEDGAPPEPLVLGAELHCPYGSESTFLIVLSESMAINNLPDACVLDCKKSKNIMPFGYCTYAGCSCEEIMELEERWENDEPQKTLSNGEEIITTKSILICKTCGEQIKPVTSGQDGVVAALMFNGAEMLWSMDEKYPGLFDILKEPYASLYLNEDMYQKALCFLEDYVEKYGEVQIQTLYSETSLETYLVRTVIERLLATCDENSESDVLNILYVRGSTNGMYDVDGWYPDLLNKEMIEFLKKDCADTAERIETKAFYRWQEENKQHICWYANKSMELAYASLILWGMTADETKMYRQEAEVKKYAENEVKKNTGESKDRTLTANPYDLQPTHSQTLSNKKMNALIDDIKVNGIREPIKYVEYDGQMYVVDGHHRLLAAKRLGLTEVPIEKVELPYAGYSTNDDLLWFD